jgi:uncharacterized protein (DUF3084 family)
MSTRAAFISAKRDPKENDSLVAGYSLPVSCLTRRYAQPATSNQQPATMSTPLFLLFGLTLATCVIAYWADRLGKKLGKKRVTLLGLRPRQTATLITMGSSVGIMFFTFAVLLVTNSSLRGALLRYDEERAANRQLRQDNSQLRNDQKTLEQQNKQSRQQAATAQQEAVKARNAARTAKYELGNATTELKREQERLRTAQLQEKAAHAGERAAQSSAAQARQRLATAQTQLAGVENRLKVARQDLQHLRGRLRAAQAAARSAQSATRFAQSEEKEARTKLTQQQAKFWNQTKRQVAEVNRLEEEQGKLTRQIADRQGEIARLKEIRNELGNYNPDISTQVQQVIAAGTVFAARTIAPRMPTSAVTEELRGLVSEATGAIQKTDSERTLRLVLPNGSTELSSNKVLESLVEYLASFNVPVSVRLATIRHHAQAENEIQAALFPVPARLVFSRGETIATTVINGAESDARVFNQLLELLNRGEKLAREQEVMPLLLSEKEKFYAADTNERVFEALRRIRAIGGPTTVNLVTDSNITRLDQLKIRFEMALSGA